MTEETLDVEVISVLLDFESAGFCVTVTTLYPSCRFSPEILSDNFVCMCVSVPPFRIFITKR